MAIMTTAAKDFKAILPLIDKDYRSVAKNEFKRERLYYAVTIDTRATDVIARNTVNPRTNTHRTTFLIRSAQEDSLYALSYLSETDVIAILTLLDSDLYQYIIGYLVKLYRNEVDKKAHSVRFDRESLVSAIAAASLTANSNVWVIPDFGKEASIATPLGYDISFRSFCDVLSLMLSMENSEKLKRVIAKYYVFTNLLRSESTPTDMPVPDNLKQMKTIDDVERLYDAMPRFKTWRAFDEKTFDIKQFESYFQSLE